MTEPYENDIAALLEPLRAPESTARWRTMRPGDAPRYVASTGGHGSVRRGAARPARWGVRVIAAVVLTLTAASLASVYVVSHLLAPPVTPPHAGPSPVALVTPGPRPQHSPRPSSAPHTPVPPATPSHRPATPAPTPRPTATPVPAPANAIGNPGFEGGLTGWEVETCCGLKGTLSLSNVAHSGAWSGVLERSGGDGMGETDLNDSPNWIPSAAAGTTCTATAWIRTAPGVVVNIRLREYTQGGGDNGYTSVPATATGGWQQIRVVAPVNGGGDTMDLNIYADQLPVNTPLYIDDVYESCR